MENRDQNSEDALCAEILAQARRESEQLIRRAREDADAVQAKATEEAGRARQQRLAQAKAEAARRVELILATVQVEANRRRSSAIEALLQGVYEEARRQLVTRRGFDYKATVIALAAEAIDHMEGDDFRVKLSAEDRRVVGQGLSEAIMTQLGPPPRDITISDEPTIVEGGVIVQDAAGRQLWDNRLPTRLKRLWPELRWQIAVGTFLVAGSTRAGGDP